MSTARLSRIIISVALLLILLAVAVPRAVPGPVVAQVTSQTGGSSFRWTAGYAVVQHPIPEANAEPWSITSDPRGVIWFVEQGTDQLGEYNPVTGVFTQHQIPTSGSTPDSVTSDSRGNVWFTELTTDKLAELPAGGGNITEFPIPSAVVALGASSQTLSCGPGSVLADPSGVIWVTCLFSNQIDEFNPAGRTFDTFDLPVFQSAPAGMALSGNGTLWFTAADSYMLGKAVVSQLRNGTSDGISEFAPLNQTYAYHFNHATSFLGGTEVITSSLGTPSGIALDPSGKLWVTEHVDSSFDSFDTTTQSLVKYWTTQTFGAYGYTVTFPNGIAVGHGGTVWIGEHYGNRIAEFAPSTGAMTEYPVPCCGSIIAGVYSIALAPDGRLWFVEIGGDAIGELVPVQDASQLSLGLPTSSFAVSSGGQVTLPLSYAEGSGNATALTLSVTGVSPAGTLQNATASFSSSTIQLSSGARAASNLTISDQGLKSGSYYLTLGATDQKGVIYSAILKLTVSSGAAAPPPLFLAVAVVSVVVAGALGALLARRSQAGRARRRAARRPQSRARASPATPTATAPYIA